MKIDKYFASSISTIFNPLLMPTIGVILILNFGEIIHNYPYQIKNLILIICAGTTFILPLSFYPIYYYKGMVSGINIENHRDRIIPLAVTLLLYIGGFMLIERYIQSKLLQGFWLGFTISVLINLLVSFSWKISSHMIGIGGLIALILVFWLKYRIDLSAYLMLGILVAGLVGFSRLKLNYHSLSQIIAGFGFGFLAVLFTMYLY